MHKKIIIVVFLVVAFATTSVLVIPKYSKVINFEVIEKSFQNDYQELRVLDEYDISMYFGIEENELEKSLFMTDFISTEDNPYVFDPKDLIIIIRDKEIDYYYDILYGYLDSNKNNYLIDTSLYENAILKKDNGYLYLFLGKENAKMEEKLKKLLEK